LCRSDDRRDSVLGLVRPLLGSDDSRDSVLGLVRCLLGSDELACAFMVPGKVCLDLFLHFLNFPPSPPPPTASPVSTFSVSIEFS
jgi:hypothetical protein